MFSKFCLTCTSILCILMLSQYAVVVQCICENMPICQWSLWHEWSSCNATCGSGMKSRWRSPCCDASKANSFMECINVCNLSSSAYKDYQSCSVACSTPPTTLKTTETTQSTISTVISTILQLTEALETTTVRHVTTTLKPKTTTTTTATTTKTSVITTAYPQTKASPTTTTTTSKPKSSTSVNVYLKSSPDEQKTRPIIMRTTTPSGTTSKTKATPASVSPSASKAVLSGKKNCYYLKLVI